MIRSNFEKIDLELRPGKHTIDAASEDGFREPFKFLGSRTVLVHTDSTTELLLPLPEETTAIPIAIKNVCDFVTGCFDKDELDDLKKTFIAFISDPIYAALDEASDNVENQVGRTVVMDLDNSGHMREYDGEQVDVIIRTLMSKHRLAFSTEACKVSPKVAESVADDLLHVQKQLQHWQKLVATLKSR
jgi:hypothetical protein